MGNKPRIVPISPKPAPVTLTPPPPPLTKRITDGASTTLVFDGVEIVLPTKRVDAYLAAYQEAADTWQRERRQALKPR